MGKGTIVLVTALAVFAVTMAGCADNDPTNSANRTGTTGSGVQPGQVVATEKTGGIRGVVVDANIRPIGNVKVTVLETKDEAQTDEGGTFVFNNLNPGRYTVAADHPRYNKAQQTAEVVAGVKAPKPVQFQLKPLTSEVPYMRTEKFEGFITCSANVLIPTTSGGFTGVLSEECGEGVGVPCQVPGAGCTRVAGNPNNNAQIDYLVEGDFVKTIIQEQVWEPTSEAGKGFYTLIGTRFACDPVCENKAGGVQMAQVDGNSPLIARLEGQILLNATLSASEKISSMTWASARAPGVLLNQDFELFVSAFYYKTAPEGWSFVRGDVNPFA